MMKRTLFSISFAIVVLQVSFAQNSGCALSLSVEDCIELARNANVNVKNTHLDYLSATMRKREAAASYFPTVDIRAMGFAAYNPLVRIGLSDVLGSSDAANNLKYALETEAAMNGISSTFSTLNNAYGASVVLTQPIFAGGRIVNGNRLASLGIQAASLNESIARRDLGADVEQKYWLVVSLEEKLKVVDDALALAEKLTADARSAYSAGLVTDSDTDEVELKRQDLKAKKIRLKGSVMLARMNLCNALGICFSEASSLLLEDRLEDSKAPDFYYRDPSGIVDGLEESKLLDLTVKQKELEKKMAMGEALPEIGVGAAYGYGHFIGTPQTNGAVYATVKIPLTDWSKAGSKMKNIDFQMEKARNEREYLCAMLELQLRQLWVEVESTWEELQLKNEDVELAVNMLEKARADFSAGLATQSQLMSREVSLSETVCKKIDAGVAYRNAVNAYLAKCGR